MDTQAVLDNVSTISSDNAIIVDAKEFLTELRQVAGAVAKPSEQRPNLTFVHMILSESSIKLEATDSHVLDSTYVAASVAPELVGKQILLDGKFAKNLSKAPTKHKGTLGIYPAFDDEKYLGKTTIVLDGEAFINDSRENISSFGYPDLEMLQPYWEGAQVEFKTTKKEILPLLREIKKATNSKNNYSVDIDGAMNLVCNEKKLSMTMWGLETGDKLDKNFENWRNTQLVSFNVTKLISEIKNAKPSETLTFRFWGKLRPFTISRENGGYSLVCPIRKF